MHRQIWMSFGFPFDEEELVDAFGDNGVIESICQDDFGPALDRIAERIAVVLTPGCIPDLLLDADGNTANGHQPDCRVIDRVPNEITGMTQDTIIENICDNMADPDSSTNKPCFLVAKTPECTIGGGWRADVYRDGEAAPGTLMVVECLICEPDAPQISEGLCQ